MAPTSALNIASHYATAAARQWLSRAFPLRLQLLPSVWNYAIRYNPRPAAVPLRTGRRSGGLQCFPDGDPPQFTGAPGMAIDEPADEP